MSVMCCSWFSSCLFLFLFHNLTVSFNFQAHEAIQLPARPRPGLIARGEIELELVELAVPTPSRRSEFPAPPFSLEIVSDQ